MKSLLLTVLAFGLLSSCAFAQEGLEKKQYGRAVASGKNQRIGFFYSLTPDLGSTSTDTPTRSRLMRHPLLLRSSHTKASLNELSKIMIKKLFVHRVWQQIRIQFATNGCGVWL